MGSVKLLISTAAWLGLLGLTWWQADLTVAVLLAGLSLGAVALVAVPLWIGRLLVRRTDRTTATARRQVRAQINAARLRTPNRPQTRTGPTTASADHHPGTGRHRPVRSGRHRPHEVLTT